jgi:hypothetical protein
VNCPKCGADLSSLTPAESPTCPQCGTPISGGAINAETRPAGRRAEGGNQADSSPEGGEAGAAASEPIVGVVVTYSEVAEGSGNAEQARLGQVYPLRAGQVLFIGKPPAPAEVLRADGTNVAPAATHLFPFTPDFAHISRRHLIIEADSAGVVLVTDYSTNGIFLLRSGTFLQRRPEQPSLVHRLETDETIVLGLDLSDHKGDPATLERVSRYQIRLLRPERSVLASKG